MFELVNTLKNIGLMSVEESNQIKKRLFNKWIEREYADWVYFVEFQRKERVNREEIREVFRFLREFYRKNGVRTHDNDSKISQQILNCLDEIDTIEIKKSEKCICMKCEKTKEVFTFYMKDGYHNEWLLFDMKIFNYC